MQQLPELPRSAWERIILRTTMLTLLSIGASLLVSHFLLVTFSGGLDAIGITAAITIPAAVGGPMIFHLSRRNHELQAACRQLEKAASIDSLTGCLNHGAFITRVKERLKDPGMSGALLVVDADFFKSINDRFGHECGDLALRHIVARIEGAVRADDLVGRLGGEEFGVFLPHACSGRATTVAETIRRNISAMDFEVESERCPLSVSIGGAVFWHAAGFAELFRCADRQLYAVKKAGRNQINLTTLDAALPSRRFAQAS